MYSFYPFPVITTPSLTLRQLGAEHAEDIFAMRSDPRMHVHTDTAPDVSIDETRAYIDNMNKGVEAGKWIIWAMEHRQSRKVIGTISIWNITADSSGELGYGITPLFQGKGLMKEALKAIIEYGFAVMRLNLLEAYTEDSNTESNCLLERVGFARSTMAVEQGIKQERVFNMVVYRRWRGTYPQPQILAQA